MIFSNIDSKSKYWAPFVLIVVCAAVYINALPNEFVYDDRALFIEHADIWKVQNLKLLLTSQDNLFGQSQTGYFRPLPNISFLIDYYLWGQNPAGFRLTNIVWHCLTTLAVFFLALILFKTIGVAFLGALLFAVHPVHTEVVTWINGRNNAMAGFFYIGTVAFYIRNRLYVSKYRYTSGSLVFFVLSLACKEYAVSLPVLIVCFEWIFRKELSGRISSPWMKTALFASLPYFSLLAIFWSIRKTVLFKVAPNPYLASSLTDRLLAVPKTVWLYLKLIFYPDKLTLFHTVNPVKDVRALDFIVPLIGCIVLLILIYLTHKNNKPLAFCLMWVLVPLIPVLNIHPLSDYRLSMAERYAYIPIGGACLLFAWAMLCLWRIGSGRSFLNGAVAIGISLVVMESLALSTIKRNLVWRNEMTLWQDTVSKSPGAFIPRTNYAIALASQGSYDLALHEINRAINLMPVEKALPYFMKGLILSKLGNTDEAFALVQRSLRIAPNYKGALELMGALAYRRADYRNAIQIFRKLNRLEPNSAEHLYNIGIGLQKMEKLRESLKFFKLALKKSPKDARIHYHLVEIYRQLNQPREATHHLGKARLLEATKP